MNNRKFDCVEMKRQGAAVVLEKIQSMTRDEELSYWRKRTNEMKRSKKQAKRSSRVKANIQI